MSFISNVFYDVVSSLWLQVYLSCFLTKNDLMEQHKNSVKYTKIYGMPSSVIIIVA